DIHQRCDLRLIPDCLQVRMQIALTSLLKAFVLLLFLRETLHDPNGSQRLVRQRRHSPGTKASFACGRLKPMRISKNDPEQQWGDGECRQRHSPTEPEHQCQ